MSEPERSAEDLARLRRDLLRRFRIRSNDGPLRPRDAVGMRNLVSYFVAADQPDTEAGGAVNEWFRDGVEEMLGPPGGTSQWNDRWVGPVTAGHRAAVATGALYLVTSNMSALIDHASATLPSFTISLTAVPSPKGYCLMASPSHLGDIGQVQAFSWCVGADLEGAPVVLVGIWAVPDDGAPGPVGLRWHYSFMDDDFFDGPGDGDGAAEAWRAVTWLVTFWRMVGEEWVSIDRTTPKASRGTSGQRGGAAPSEVRIVTLRRARGHETDPDVAGAGVDYSHRWWVRGHWRNQWYPSQQRHAPRWIRGHIKGPEDKPFITKETVNVLRR